MSPVTIVFVYLVVWWTVLFAVLPLGVRSHWEEGVETPGGGDPSSPVDPKLKRKFITTSWVAALVTAAFVLAIQLHLVHLPQFPGRG